MLPIVGFAGVSGSGKTTLITAVLPLLRAEGLRVGVVKHAHCGFDMDRPGKDSYRVREAGAAEVLIASWEGGVTARRTGRWEQLCPPERSEGGRPRVLAPSLRSG